MPGQHADNAVTPLDQDMPEEPLADPDAPEPSLADERLPARVGAGHRQRWRPSRHRVMVPESPPPWPDLGEGTHLRGAQSRISGGRDTSQMRIRVCGEDR